MIGDNLEWEIEVPQRLGIYAIWMDAHGEGLPAESTVKPDRIIRSLTELLPLSSADSGCGGTLKTTRSS
jgi:putative hydrolase of the HAD superfamily